jgi:hypothetical protein
MWGKLNQPNYALILNVGSAMYLEVSKQSETFTLEFWLKPQQDFSLSLLQN